MAPSLRPLLTGGDRRSQAKSAQVRALVKADPTRIAELAGLVEDDDWLVSMRAIDLLEKLAHEDASRVEPHKTVFIGALADSDRWEIRLQIVRALPLFKWSARERQRVIAILSRDVSFPQTFVRAWALDSLSILARSDPTLRPIVRRHLKAFETSGSKALVARARHVRARLESLALCLLPFPLFLFLLPQSGGSVPRPTQSVSQPFVGITYIERTDTIPRPLGMHIAQIDLTAPGIRLKLSPPAGAHEVIRQTTLEFLKAERAQLAVNAHFFWPFPSPETDVVVIGIGASEGRVYSACESPVQNYALVAFAPALNVDRSNQATLVHCDPADPEGRRVLERLTLWNTVSGSAQIVTAGVITIPEYKDAEHPGANLTPGGPNRYSNANSWYDAITARTAIGLSRDARTVTLFTVDVRGGSAGMKVREVAEMLVRDYDVWNALNLDGGGSTSMAMEDPVTHVPSLVNVSSDNPSGRAVGSSLAVYAQPRR